MQLRKTDKKSIKDKHDSRIWIYFERNLNSFLDINLDFIICVIVLCITFF